MNKSLFLLENASGQLKTITSKVISGKRIHDEEALYLYESASLPELALLSNFVREKKNGKKTFFNKNFHIEPTNVCIYSCKFCSYSRTIKKREDGWEYTMEDMMDIVKTYDNKDVTEVHIVGGVLPQYDVRFYEELFGRIKKHRPEIHVKALTPVEYHYIFKKEKISYHEGLKRMMDAGLDSIPGGGAEIFNSEIRKQIAGDKCTGEQWLEIHRQWHQLGKRSNATILYGHIENYNHRIEHMGMLRDLQDETGGFQTFIPLKFRNSGNEMSNIPEVSIIEDLKNYAVSRIYLDNFDHMKAYWPMIGRTTAQLSLSYGVDDIDGTIDDTTKIYSLAGAEEQNPSMSTEELVKLIRRVGKHPVERDTFYNIVRDFRDVEFDNDSAYRGYVSLPTVNPSGKLN